MTDLTPNIPEVVAEVTALFERYEQALIDKNVEVLDGTFWQSPHAIRRNAAPAWSSAGRSSSAPMSGSAAARSSCPA